MADRVIAASEPVLRSVDAVVMSVPDLAAGIDLYCGRLGHQLSWRNDAIGQAGLVCPDSATEIVLSTELRSEPNWLVDDAVAAAELVQAAGDQIVEPLIEIPVGRVAIAAAPF